MVYLLPSLRPIIFDSASPRASARNFNQGSPPMTDIQFKATLEMLIPLIIREIIKSRNITEQEAFEL